MNIPSLEQYLGRVADAIRSKTGSSAPIKAENFPSEIGRIPVGSGDYAEGYDAGYSDGKAYGYETGYETGYEHGFNSGTTTVEEEYNRGYGEGYETGYEHGYEQGKAEISDIVATWDEATLTLTITETKQNG